MSPLHNRQQAVCVRRACKSYGSKNNSVIVLDGLNMTVSKGAIYGLLGASGCGKTTLLKCIVGRKRLNSGQIWVLGGTPGSRESGVPGPRVGYMPQETALYGEFTIRETFKFLGWTSGMTTKAIEDRLQFLSDLFMFPDVEQSVQTLSGGQQRRLSLAVTLLHEPELLILDEPTVGLDPLLRRSIWDYFIEIAKSGETTIIITTHYIEETRQAHMVGLMRGGCFLAEEAPETLLDKFGCESLEHVFLKLSIFQNITKVDHEDEHEQKVTEDIVVPSGSNNEAGVLNEKVDNNEPKVSENIPLELRELPRKFSDGFQFIKVNHLYALIWKDFLYMWRNIPFMAFLMGLPIIVIVLCCLTIGHDPTSLHLSVVNYELEEAETCKVTPGCNSTRLSCNYLNNLQKRTLQLDFYSTEAEAKDSVRRGDTWTALIFANNFSETIRYRTDGRVNFFKWKTVYSSAKVYQDNSNQNIAMFLQRQLYLAWDDFVKDHLGACGINSKVGTVPIRWEKPIHGSESPDFRDFLAPGVMILMMFFLAATSTGSAILMERNEGMLERCLVNGVTGVELLVSLTISQFIIMAGHCRVVILSTLLLNIKYNGDLEWVTLLLLSTGLCGMSFGFVVGAVCDNFRSAAFAVLGVMFSFTWVCGVLWPIEGLADGLRPISYVLPVTKSIQSLRSIMTRGWGINMPMVYEGFIVMFIWTNIFLLISVCLLRVKTR